MVGCTCECVWVGVCWWGVFLSVLVGVLVRELVWCTCE